jgi:hypothetical protein
LLHRLLQQLVLRHVRAVVQALHHGLLDELELGLLRHALDDGPLRFWF